ncbi:MAG TPA: diguanylate cyclase [Pseudonocardiaceae bacterium]|nr:diguanylate cyclase [Pseudonocardiaceae bacterium]
MSASDPAPSVHVVAESGAGIADPGRQRLLVARKWAYQISGTSYIPLPYAEVEGELLAVVNQLFGLVAADPFDPEPAAAAGARLVAMNCIGRTTFQRTMDVLGKALLHQPELGAVRGLPDKVVTLLGTFAAGHLEAVREVTLAQQESLNRTMIAIGKDARAGLRAAEARIGAIMDSALTGIAITDRDGWILRANGTLGTLLGHSRSEFGDLSLFDLFPPDDARFVLIGRDQLVDGSLARLRQHRVMITKTGDAVPVTLTGELVRDADDQVRLVIAVQDDTELRLLQNQLTRQSLHDVVTGLPNRQFFTTRLETALHKAGRHGATLYHLDLDAFAMISDGLGRHVGDQLLKAVAERLRAVVADEQAIVARLDSDEFAILVENTATTPDAATVVGRINEQLAQPVHVDGQSVTVSAGIGVVHRPQPDLDPTELLRASDLALHRAKRHGRRQWELFDDTADETDRLRFRLATTMPSAWRMGELRLDYRPQVALDSGTAVALEPVVRWEHPRYGVVPHRQCVELAEQTGLMLPLGDWLLRSASAAPVGLPVVVELSDSQIADPDLVGRILRIDGLAPERLTVGVPVEALHGDRSAPADNLRVLADAGFGVALHGFDGAAGDLVHLEDLPVTGVRIAATVVAEQAARGGSLLDRVLTELVGVVHAAGGSVAVDGVDTDAQALWWRAAGADVALGGQFTTW